MHPTRGWPKDGPPFTFSEADLNWESEEKKAEAASRAWDDTWVGNDEEQLLESKGGESESESDGSVRPIEDESDDDPENDRQFLDFANFPDPDEPSSEEEGGGEERSDEGGQKEIEEEREDSKEDVPLAQRKKVARV